MKDQVLKLCKRLKNCTLNDIQQLLDTPSDVLELVIDYLVREKKLRETNSVYTVISEQLEKTVENKNLNLMFMYHTPEQVDFILRGFCINISTNKLQYLIGVRDDCIGDFYRIFRNLIYERQFDELLNHFFLKPQQERFRVFFNKEMYFHSYNNQLYITPKRLYAKYKCCFTDDEVQEFKNIYCYLNRIESHNQNQVCLHQRLAEGIWRRNKSFEELYSDLKSLLFS